jgi:hypothetical protein
MIHGIPRRHLAVAVLAASLAGVGAVTAAPGRAVAAPGRDAVAASPSGEGLPITVELDRAELATDIGARFGFSTVVRNVGDRPVSGLIAHLNVLSTSPDVYVDPEDWSSARTAYLPPLAVGSSTRLPWTVQAVNEGQFLLYVGVTLDRADGGVSSGGPLHLTVDPRPSLDPAGSVPVVVGMPLLVGLLVAHGWYRRRSLR